MPYRWAIRLAIEGDLRFFSHHDLMRTIERISSRAKLPLRYSQGFNPRPVFSLPCPRPVGVSSLDDRLVLALDGTIEKADLLARLNHHCPQGMRFFDGVIMENAKTLPPKRVSYEMAIPEDLAEDVSRRIEELSDQQSWPVERTAKAKRGKKFTPAATRSIDIKPMLTKLEVLNELLRFTCVSHESSWAKPSEILAMVGLPGAKYMAKLVRTKIEDDM